MVNRNDELSLDRPPRGIRMERTLEDQTIIRVRPFSFAIALPLFLFVLFWSGIIGAWFFAISFISNKSFSILMWLVIMLYIVAGLWIFFRAVFYILGRCEIRIDANEGSVFTGIGAIGRTQRFSPQSVKSIGSSAYKAHDDEPPVAFCPVIEMNNGREIKFPNFDKMRETWIAFALGKLLNCPMKS